MSQISAMGRVLAFLLVAACLATVINASPARHHEQIALRKKDCDYVVISGGMPE